MVAQLLGLKLRLLANTFRRSPWQLVGLVLGIVYGAFVVVLAVGALVAARFAPDVELTRSVVVIAGSVVMLGFIVLPLVLGVDDTLDPRRFSLFGLSRPRLSLGLALAALVGIPSIVLAIGCVATIVTWSRNPGSTILAIVAAIVAVATCVLAARVMAALASLSLSSRRARESSSAIGVVLIVLIAPVFIGLVSLNWGGRALTVLGHVADALSWTPIGAVWASPASAATGRTGSALVQLLIALAFVVLLWLAWNAVVARLLVTPGHPASSRAYGGLGWFRALPGRPTGAIAARSLTYWNRDARYWTSLLLVPLFPAIMVLALFVIQVVPGHVIALVPLPVMCLFLGWSLHNDVAYDSTAVWLHVVSGTRGAADRIGRMVPVLIIGVPLVVVGSIVTAALYEDADILPAVLGVSGGVLLIGVGLSSLSSALFPYPATKPGDSPFSQPQSSGAVAAAVQSLSFVVILLLVAPAVAFLVLGILFTPEWFLISLVSGLGVGVIVLVVGVLSGGAVFNRRGPEIMAFAVRAD